MTPEQEARAWKKTALDQAAEIATLFAELHVTREVLASAQAELAELKKPKDPPPAPAEAPANAG